MTVTLFKKIGLLIGMLFLATSSAQAGGIGKDWQSPNKYEIALHVVASSAIVLDAWSSMDIKNHNHDGHFLEESNPLMGAHPSDLHFIGAAVVSIAATTAVWYVLPRQVRWLVDATTLWVEAPIVKSNLTTYHLRLTVPFTSNPYPFATRAQAPAASGGMRLRFSF